MKALNAYCSACDQYVRLELTDEPAQYGPSPIHDGEVVCLEIGQHCTGASCPMGAVAPWDMAAHLNLPSGNSPRQSADSRTRI
jgi:hypothetical protein